MQLQQQLAGISDLNPEEVKQSQHLHKKLECATAGLRRVFNLWAAEPLGAKGARGMLANVDNVLTGHYRKGSDIAQAVSRAEQTADQYRFFHWPIEFPHIFHRQTPGFDVVCGNPPWNKVKFEKALFLALRDPGYLGLRSTLDRDYRESKLLAEFPALRIEMQNLISIADNRRNFYRSTNSYVSQGSGDTDLFKLFCERYIHLVSNNGRIGVVLPRSVFLNDGSQKFRQWIFNNTIIQRIDTILNNRRWAFPIHPQYSIALISAHRIRHQCNKNIFITGPSKSYAEFSYASGTGGVELTVASLGDQYALPLVPTQNHANILAKIHQGIAFKFLDFAGLQNLKISILT